MSSTKGINRAHINTDVDPCVDFYQFANGKYLATAEIPAGYPSWGAFYELHEKNQQACLELVLRCSQKADAPRGSVEQQIGDFYYAAMNEKQIEAVGVTPLKPLLERINKIRNITQFMDEVTTFHKNGLSALFGFGSSPDLLDATQNIAAAGQGGIGLPDRDYYLKDDERSLQIRAKYLTYIERLLVLAGSRPKVASRHAAAILAFETRLAKCSMDKVERRNPQNIYNKMTVAQFTSLCPSLPLKRYLKKLEAPSFDTLNVAQPDFFKELSEVVSESPLWTLRAYLRWSLLRRFAPHLSSAFVEANFELTSTLSGTKEMLPRQKRVMNLIDSYMGEPLGQLYVTEHFPAQAKERVLNLVENISASLRESLKAAKWLSDDTRAEALNKLASFEAFIGYPDKWSDYSKIEITRYSFIDNLIAISRYAAEEDLLKIGTAVDKTEWEMPPQMVNAYYHPLNNQIVFPAGILQPPFFHPEADEAFIYGAIGAVIGHEMTHGFDDSGSQFDAEGNMRNWWTEKDATEFKARTQIIIDQFNGFSVSGAKVNGELVVGEASSDLGGLRLAYRALQNVLQKSGRRTIDGYTDEQRFFIAFAQVWAVLQTPEMAQLQVNTDPHPPAQHRVNGTLAHLPEFAAAWGRSEEDCPLLLPPQDRCHIW